MRAPVVVAVLFASAAARAESPPPPPEPEPIDLLVVVDRAPAMAEEIAVFSAALDGFADELMAQFPGDFNPAIDLHVGVITADGGELRTVDTAACAAAPTERYVRYAFDPWGDLTANFDGTLAAAIRCLLPATADGAAGQPLDAIRAALDGSIAVNAGFLRDDAALALLVVTNREDCSAAQPLPAGDPTYACAADGWTCTPPIDGTPQVHTGCTATATPTYLRPWVDAAAFVTALETLPERIAVGVLRGAPTPVEVVAGPAIAPSCGTAGREATPGLRVDAVAQSFTHHVLGHLCEGDLAADLANVARAIADAANADEWVPPPGDGVPPDADVPDDAPPHDAGALPTDARPGESLDGGGAGCGCATTGSPGSGLVLALGVLLITRRRRGGGRPALRGSRACTRSSRSRRRSSSRPARPARA